jgi:sugar phosphate permease
MAGCAFMHCKSLVGRLVDSPPHACHEQVVIAYTIGVALMLAAFWAVPADVAWLQWVTVFMIGFFLYGPQMLIGLCGAELVGPESVGASEVTQGAAHELGRPRNLQRLQMLPRIE